ncbi:DNA-3-methyladenine glycosylase family protein [Xinfangfangia pollutisoli]|uniref:DNA-3-methyladenine glycosylase family protein n=1 Tax=Xinfangfangia pollutisoli TaxID=2865960 RepID=UPI00384B3BE5
MRFHGNLYADSERLAQGAEALVAYLDRSETRPEEGLATPQDEAEAWLSARGWHLDEAETAPGAAAIAAEIEGLASDAARALARARLDYAALRTTPDGAVVAGLVALPGIGRWTAEIYAMFALGRADVFAPGDLALQEAARLVFDLPERPSERALRAMAEDWSPWRAVAARALWAYYRQAKNREGIRT